jgi:hypothetical protein
MVFGKLNYMMQMNQWQWMYGDRRTSEYIIGLHNFGDVARANIQNGFMCYPCVDYENKKEYSSWKILHSHLLQKGFMPSYNCWTKHGEREVMMEDNEEEENDDMYPEYSDTAMGEAEDEEIGEDEDEEASNEPADDLRRVIVDAYREAESVNEKQKLKDMLEDHKKTCTQIAKMATQSSVQH